MRQKRKDKYRYTTVTVDGKKQSLYLGKPSSSPQAHEHQQKMEQKRTTREREQELDQLQTAVDRAMDLLHLMIRGHLLLAGHFVRKSELRKLKEEDCVQQR
jgi:hypothetical protein